MRVAAALQQPPVVARAWPPSRPGVPWVGRPFGQILAQKGAVGDKYLVTIDFVAPRTALSPRWALANWRSNPLETGGPEFAGDAPLTVRGQLDVFDGSSWKSQKLVFPHGADSATVNTGCTVWAEYPGAVGGGAQCRLVLWVDPGASGTVPLSGAVMATDPGVGHSRGPSITQPTWGQPVAARPQVAESTFVPIACVAQPAAQLPVVGLLGDSITMGLGDLPAGFGYAVRALDAAGIPWLSLAVGGDFLIDWHLLPVGLRRCQQIAGCDWLLEAWGTNNLGLLAGFGSTDPSPVMSTKVRLWRSLAKTGAGVVSITQVPVRNSDPTAQARLNQLRNTLVAWQRDGAPWDVGTGEAVPAGAQGSSVSRCRVLNPDGSIRQSASGPQHPLAAMFDVAATVEDPAVDGGNQWRAGMNADTVHPSTAGHQAMAQAVRVEVLRQRPPIYGGP